MNPDVPELPSIPAADKPAAPLQHLPVEEPQHEEMLAPAEETLAGAGLVPHQPAPAAPEPRAHAVAQQASPTMPAMPGEPAGEEDLDEDDDIEIPDEVGYEQIVKTTAGAKPEAAETSRELVRGTVVSQRHDGVFVDIGHKAEAFLPFEPSRQANEQPEVGEVIEVIVTGESHQGYLQLSSLKTQRPAGWMQLEAAFNSGSSVLGKVTGTIKGGLSVDVGVRAFMPASRSGERSEEGLEALVGKEVRALIVQFDEADRNVVLDRRAVLNEERKRGRAEALVNLEVGETVSGTVRSLREFGAFVDIGGIDGLLHISDIAWRHIKDPSDELRVGQKLVVKILKVDRGAQKVGVGLKQLQAEPWSTVADHISVDEVIDGTVTKLKDFGAFVEVMPGVEGLVHISDMSYSNRVRHPSEVVSAGDSVKVHVKNIDVKKRRIGLSLREALGDPWKKVGEEHPVNSTTTGTVRKIMSFGAFVGIAEGVDGLLHISDITSERRLNSPAEVLKEGQQVKVKILEINVSRRRLKVGMKQLQPTELETALAQVEVGETVTGRVVKVENGKATVEIGEGLSGVCVVKARSSAKKSIALGQTSDLGSLKSMLESAWKGADGMESEEPPPPSDDDEPDPLVPGAVLSFKVKKVDPASGIIELFRA